MRTEIKEIKIYKFEELSEEIKEDLINKYTEEEWQFYIDYELQFEMENEAQELLQKYFGDKATFKSVYYDLSYTQGRGSMIEFDLNYYNMYIQVKHNDNFYYHELTFRLDYYDYLGEKREKQLSEKIYKMNKELTSYGDSLINNEEYFKELAIDRLSEKEFTENGEIY